jgi:hypothetical protein
VLDLLGVAGAGDESLRAVTGRTADRAASLSMTWELPLCGLRPPARHSASFPLPQNATSATSRNGVPPRYVAEVACCGWDAGQGSATSSRTSATNRSGGMPAPGSGLPVELPPADRGRPVVLADLQQLVQVGDVLRRPSGVSGVRLEDRRALHGRDADPEPILVPGRGDDDGVDLDRVGQDREVETRAAVELAARERARRRRRGSSNGPTRPSRSRGEDGLLQVLDRVPTVGAA